VWIPEHEEDKAKRLEVAKALAPRHEVYEHQEHGVTTLFDVTLGWYILYCLPRETDLISLSQAGIGEAHVRTRYPTLDWTYARTTNLRVPLLFVPWEGKHLLIDGWHRLAHACLKGVDELPAYLLTEAERDMITEAT
jgi:hypothetical protein